MNELYNEYIERNGRHYRYDPDHDLYYRCDPQKEETAKERWTSSVLALPDPPREY